MVRSPGGEPAAAYNPWRRRDRSLRAVSLNGIQEQVLCREFGGSPGRQQTVSLLGILFMKPGDESIKPRSLRGSCVSLLGRAFPSSWEESVLNVEQKLSEPVLSNR